MGKCESLVEKAEMMVKKSAARTGGQGCEWEGGCVWTEVARREPAAKALRSTITRLLYFYYILLLFADSTFTITARTGGNREDV